MLVSLPYLVVGLVCVLYAQSEHIDVEFHRKVLAGKGHKARTEVQSETGAAVI